MRQALPHGSGHFALARLVPRSGRLFPNLPYDICLTNHFGLGNPGISPFPFQRGCCFRPRSAPENLPAGGFDRLGTYAEMAVEVRNRASLAEMLDAERHGAMPQHTTKPA